MKDKIGYALGDFASVLVFGLVQSVLQKYYTDVLGIGVVGIMVMFIVARIWDAVNDPLWGRIIDRAPVWPDGRYRHWLKVFCVPVAIAAILMFVKIPGLSEKGYLVYAYVTYILFGMVYTCINIPYGSLAQVITSDEKERSSLSVFRSIGSTFGAIPAMLLISLCYVKLEDGRSVMSYRKIIIGVIVIAVFCVLGFLLSYRWTRERVKTRPMARGETLRVVKILLHSRPFMAVSIASMLFLAAQMFSQSYYTYPCCPRPASICRWRSSCSLPPKWAIATAVGTSAPTGCCWPARSAWSCTSWAQRMYGCIFWSASCPASAARFCSC